LLSISYGAPRKAQDAIRARLKQDLAESSSHLFCISRRTALVAAEMFLAVGGKHTSLKKQATSFQPRPGSERDLAAPF
jgi:hypothetical protein